MVYTVLWSLNWKHTFLFYYCQMKKYKNLFNVPNIEYCWFEIVRACLLKKPFQYVLQQDIILWKLFQNSVLWNKLQFFRQSAWHQNERRCASRRHGGQLWNNDLWYYIKYSSNRTLGHCHSACCDTFLFKSKVWGWFISPKLPAQQLWILPWWIVHRVLAQRSTQENAA